MRQAFFYLAALTLALATLQFLLAGIGIFGAGDFDAHRAVGFAMHGPPLLMIVVALAGRLGRALVLSAVALLLLVSIQSGLPNGPDWLAALHPLVALVIWVGAAQTLARSRRADGAVTAAA